MNNESRKTALITGASSGMGREFARIHAEKGGDLVIVARSEKQLENLKSELEQKHQINVKVIVKDLYLPDSPQEIYNEVKQAGIEVDYLINDAGHGGLGEFHELPWDRNINQIKLNIIALTQLTYLFLQDFVKNDEGRILNVSSAAALAPGPLQAVYYATKSYVNFFSYAIAEELSDTNITVTVLMPSAVDTKFGAVSGFDKTSLWNDRVNPRDVAMDGYNAMIAGKLDVVSGLSFFNRMLLGLQPFMPKRFLLRYVHRAQTPIM